MSGKKNGFSIEELKNKPANFLKAHVENVSMNYRRKNQFDIAFRENEKCLIVFKEKLAAGDTGLTYADLSKLEYEQGYIEFLLGHYESSVKLFGDSAISSEKADDPVGVEIGKFRMTHTKVFANTTHLEDARKEMILSFNRLSELLEEGYNASRCGNWMFNIEGRLFDLAIELHNVEDAEEYFSRFLEHPSTQDNLASDAPNSRTLLNKFSREGRLNYIRGAYDEALGNFAAFLEVDLSQWGAKDDRITVDLEDVQEVSRDYLYAGRCLRQKGLEAQAERAFEGGLAQNPHNANHYFQDKIREEIKRK